MKPTIAVIDYGTGNLRSVHKALEFVGAHVSVTDSPSKVRQAQAVVLPGVGAFGEAVKKLQRQRLWSVLSETLENQKPFLGICLGLQLLLEESEESPGIKGFGYLKGKVVRFKSKAGLKVPHMGWNQVNKKRQNLSPWMKSMRSDDRPFYFVHSYFAAPKDSSWVAATTSYGNAFCSAVAGPSLLACQFHPEKSGVEGLRFLKQFVKGVHALC